MLAAIQNRYGAPDVLTVAEVEAPTVGEREILVRVHASPITQGDRRLRAADFPGITRVLGRLAIGVFGPRHRVPGTGFAGRVVAVGASVTRYAVGDDVFGSAMHGAHAELLTMAEDGPVARMPRGFGYDEAAALPYGGVTALRFLRDFGGVQPGQRVLILGASGGVGRLAVQLAHHLGAEVTGVASGDQAELVRSLGADHVIDYQREDFTRGERRYDVILDTGDRSSFGRARGSLTPTGRYLSLHVSLRVLFQAAYTRLRGGRRAMFGVAFGDAEDIDAVRQLAEDGALRPVLDRSYPLGEIARAHAHLEQAHPHGSVIVTVAA